VLKALPAILKMNVAMLANPYVLIALGIAAVIAGIVMLTIHFDKLTAMWRRFENASLGVKVAIGFVVAVIEAVLGPVATLVHAMIGIAGVARSIIDGWTPIKEFFESLWSSVTNGIDKAMKAIDLLANNPILNTFVPIQSVASGIRAVGSGASAVGGGIAGLGRGMADVLAGPEPTLSPGSSGEPIGGRLDIHVTADGHARVTRAEPAGGMPWSVNTGFGMSTP
jgi:hypothetical protein